MKGKKLLLELKLRLFFQLFSVQVLGLTLLTLSTPTFQRTEDKGTQLTTKLVWNTQQNLGVLVELYPVFLVLVAQEQADQVKVPSETCVEKEECSLQSESGENGIENPTLNKKNSLLQHQLLLLLSFPLFKQEDIDWIKSQSSHLLLITHVRLLKELRRLLDF